MEVKWVFKKFTVSLAASHHNPFITSRALKMKMDPQGKFIIAYSLHLAKLDVFTKGLRTEQTPSKQAFPSKKKP